MFLLGTSSNENRQTCAGQVFAFCDIHIVWKFKKFKDICGTHRAKGFLPHLFMVVVGNVV